MKIYVSRFTPGLKNGKDVSFNVGETVTYRTLEGETVEIKIDSPLMTKNGHYGYEAIFRDDGKRYFSASERIIDWGGKC